VKEDINLMINKEVNASKQAEMIEELEELMRPIQDKMQEE
jgi:hypothetical protein